MGSYFFENLPTFPPFLLVSFLLCCHITWGYPSGTMRSWWMKNDPKTLLAHRCTYMHTPMHLLVTQSSILLRNVTKWNTFIIVNIELGIFIRLLLCQNWMISFANICKWLCKALLTIVDMPTQKHFYRKFWRFHHNLKQVSRLTTEES